MRQETKQDDTYIKLLVVSKGTLSLNRLALFHFDLDRHNILHTWPCNIYFVLGNGKNNPRWLWTKWKNSTNTMTDKFNLVSEDKEIKNIKSTFCILILKVSRYMFRKNKRFRWPEIIW